jgi:hypothetical protein
VEADCKSKNHYSLTMKPNKEQEELEDEKRNVSRFVSSSFYCEKNSHRPFKKQNKIAVSQK